MAAASISQFHLIVPKTASSKVKPGSDVTVPCHLSPEISAVAMEIRWFRETDCVCLYKNRQMIEGRGYEGRVNLSTEMLERGYVSISLKDFTESDVGDYLCEVTSEDTVEEVTVRVLKTGSEDPDIYDIQTEKIVRTWTDEEKMKMRSSDLMTGLKTRLCGEGLDVQMERMDRTCTEEERRKMEYSVIMAELMEKFKNPEDFKSFLSEKDTKIKHLEEQKEKLLTEQEKLIQEKERILLENKQTLQMRDATLEEKDKHLKDINDQLQQTIKDLKEKDNQLEEKQNQLEEKENQLEEKENQLEEKENQLEEKENQLEEKENQLEEKENQLEEKQNQLEEKETQLDNMNKLMSEKERLLENTVKDLDSSKHQLETLRNELQDKSSRLQLLLEENKLLKSSETSTASTAPVRRRNSKQFDPPYMSEETAPVSVPASELRLVLLGSAGSEKSAAGNIILGREKNQTDTSTEIQQSESRQQEVDGKQVTVVETPDWFCSGLSLEEVRQDVGLCVRLSAPGPHAFLLLIPVQQSTGVEREMLEKMEEILGERCLRNTLILFTVTDKEQEKNIEEFVQSGNQEIQRLVEKCGNRFHCLHIHQSGDGSQVSELLEKIEKMVEENTERFYCSEMYLEIDSQIRAMERQIMREREERKEREEKELKEKIEKEVQKSLRKIEGVIEEHEGEIKQLNERTDELERQMREERDEEKKKELKRELEKEVEKRSDLEREINRLKDQREREKSEMERHRQEMEEIRQMYEGEIREETERKIMKIILPELKRNISDSKSKMQVEFIRQMEEKNRELETLKNNLTELKDKHSLLSEFYESAMKSLKSS